MRAPVLSVVIPTLNRLGALERSLTEIRAQRVPEGSVEVVVVDNGSTDGTVEHLARCEHQAGLPMRWSVERRPGPAAARNAGVALARARQVLFLGDDTRPAHADLFAAHVAAISGPGPARGMLGKVAWDPERPITSFMRWLDDGGPQFHFNALDSGLVDPAAHLYTAHVSVPTALLEEVGGFDERFTTAAVEDLELGARLGRAGMELTYRPDLLVWHDHPTDYGASLRRLARVGEAGRRYHELFPGRPQPGVGAPSVTKARVLDALAAALVWRRAGERLPTPVRHARWLVAHQHAYGEGFRRAGRP